ncbi:MAG TPA: MFS transporter [Alphaproteobacteria bacterium]|nr:MFS transporter [Alphaproteobacteria bacterium]
MAEQSQPAKKRVGPWRQFSWCMYDWANSPFPTIIATFLFANYYAGAVVGKGNDGEALWAIAAGVAGVLTALLSPVLGAFADQGGRRKPWLGVITAIMVVATALMWFVEPSPAFILLGFVLAVIATTAFEVSMVFYNAMLPDIAPENRVGRISGWGWGLGYAGGLTALVICLFVLVQADPLGLGLDRSDGALENVRATNILVAVWIVLFTLPFWLFVPDRPATGKRANAIVREGLGTLVSTLKRWREYRSIVRFLIAFLLYSNGYNTLFALGAVYARQKFGWTLADVLQFGIALNVVAGLGAFGFAWVDDFFGAKRTVLIAVAAITVFAAGALLVETETLFWVFGLALSTFFGPAQAASRSMMARMAPPEIRTELFGLYGLAGRVASWAGALAVGGLAFATGSFRIGMVAILFFLIAGLIMLWGVRYEQK